MSDDEAFIFIAAGFAGGIAAFVTAASFMPRAFTSGNAAVGLLRVSMLFSLGWAGYVLAYHGDPSIVGIYVAFYLMLAYTAAKIFGQAGARFLFGLHLQSDIFERRNPAAAVAVAAFTAATGLIFGGSLWGEADPVGDGEGGWWIPVGFFLMGWGILVVATALYAWREPGSVRLQIRQERDTRMAWRMAVFILTCGHLLLAGVSGDFWGWRHGVLGMGTIALMLVGHEFVLLFSDRTVKPGLLRHIFEQVVYIGLGSAAWALNRVIDQTYAGG
jgi:hypothetical protein